jgi:hypothetical protein
MRFIATLLRGLAVSPKARSSYFTPRLSSDLEALFLVAAVCLEGKRHAKRQWRDLVRTRDSALHDTSRRKAANLEGGLKRAGSNDACAQQGTDTFHPVLR